MLNRAVATGVDTVGARESCGNRSDPGPSKRGLRRREEHPVENVLKLDPELRVESPFPTEGEVSGETHRLGRLPLPTAVTGERSRRPPMPRPRIFPGGRVESDRSLRVKAMAVRIDRQRIDAGNSVVVVLRSSVETTAP